MRFLIGLFLMPLVAFGAGNFYHVPDSLNFTNQPGWSTPFSQLVGNTTEDFNYCRIPSSQSSLTGLVTLASPLPAGRYSIFLYGASGTNSSPNVGGGQVSITSGTSSNSMVFQTGAPAYYTNMTFVLETTTSTLPLVFSNRFLGSMHMDFWLKKIYITDNTNEFPGSDGPNGPYMFFDWSQPPTNMTDLITFNYLANSSFELGSDKYGWTWVRQQTPSIAAQRFYMREGVSTSDAFEGLKSFEFGTNHASSKVFLPPIRLRGTNCFRPYTLSFYARATVAGSSISGEMGHSAGIYPFSTTRRFPTNKYTFTFSSIATSWTRYQTNLYFAATPSRDLYAWLNSTLGGIAASDSAFIDAVMFQEGTMASAYEPNYPVEFGLDSKRANGVFDTAETITLDLITYNHTASTVPLSFDYQAYNWRNAITTNGSNVAITATAGALTNTVTIANPSNGTSRVVIWSSSYPGLRNELVFTRSTLTNATTGNITNKMGVQGNYFDGAVRSNNIYGFTWDRTVSPGNIFRWGSIEPSSNNFVWTLPDVAVQAMTNSSTNRLILGSLGGPGSAGFSSFCPAWVLTNGVPRMNSVSNFAWTNVSRYKQWIHVWEDANETTVPATNQAMWFEALIAGIKAADPTALIIGPDCASGFISSDNYLTNVWDNLSAGALANVFGASIHIYPNSQVDYMDIDQLDNTRFKIFKTAATRYGKVMTDTESGDPSVGVHKTDMLGMLSAIDGHPDYDHLPEYQLRRESVERAMRNRLEALGWNYRIVFYHEARLGDLSYAQENQQYRIYDEDDTMRPMGAAWMWINNLIGYSTTATPLTNSTSTNIYGFLFEQGALKTLAVWNAERGTNRMVVVTNTGFTVWDLQGNRIQTALTNIIVNKRPQFWTTTTLTSNQCAQTFINTFSVTSIADSNAPFVSVDKTLCGQAGSSRYYPFDFGWTAMDDTWLNVDRYPHVVETRFKIVNLSNDWSSWSAVRTVRLQTPPASGTYYLAVQARDTENLATNEVTGPLFTVGESMPPPGLSGKAFLGGKISIR